MNPLINLVWAADLLLLLMVLSTIAQAQPRSAVLNTDQIGVTASRSQDYREGVVYHFVNETSQNVDIVYYFKRTNGQWSDARGINDMEPGREYASGDTCDNGGSYVLYVRPAGSDDRFPNRPFY